jgi:hypothetical protein
MHAPTEWYVTMGALLVVLGVLRALLGRRG